ncbi:lipopolysaccharide kinase [Hirsutella rhossiliensis]
MSPVMEVQMKTPGGHRNVLLKLFDRRFGGDRRRQPYNQEAEAAWQNCLRSGLAQNLLESLQEDEEIIKMARFQEDDDDDNDDSDEEEEEEEEDDERQLQEQEVVIYHATQKGYKSEVRAYTELKSLQGRCIPSFIASVVDESPPAPPDLPAGYFHAPGIIIQYIHGFPLTELHLKIPDSPHIWNQVVDGAIEIVKQVNRAGVVHLDCQPRNIIVSETGHGKFRSYLIDFAQAAFKDDFKDTDDVDDEKGFKHQIHRFDNHGAVAVIMSLKIARETPYKLHFQYVAKK